MPLNKIVQIAFFVLTVVNGLFYFDTVIDLLQQYVGDLAYVLCIVVAPFLSPAMLGLPWFNAWVNNGALSYGLLLLWSLWVVAIGALALYGTAAARTNRQRKR